MEYSANGGSTWTTSNSNASSPYTVPGLVDGQTYIIRVTWTDSLGTAYTNDGTLGQKASATQTATTATYLISPHTASLSIAAGGSAGHQLIDLARSGGHSSTVTYSATATPTGALPNPVGFSASFLPATSSGPTNDTVDGSFSVGSGTTAGDYTVTVSATDGILTKTTTFTLTVTSNPDFSFTLTPGSASVVSGSSVSGTIAIGRINGHTAGITFTIPSAPAGVTLTPTTPVTGSSAAYTISTTTSTPNGSYTLNIQGSDGTIIHIPTYVLTVTGTYDYSATASPNTLTLSQGGSASPLITISAINASTGTVTIGAASVTGTGVTASVNSPTSFANSSGTTTVTINANGSALGSYTVTIPTSDNLGNSHNITINLTVSSGSPPTSGTASFVTASQNSITVITTAATPSLGGSIAYQWYRNTVAGTSPPGNGWTAISGASGLSCTDTAPGVTAGIPVYYKVVATESGTGLSVVSGIVSAGLWGAPVRVGIIGSSTTSNNLRWPNQVSSTYKYSAASLAGDKILNNPPIAILPLKHYNTSGGVLQSVGYPAFGVSSSDINAGNVAAANMGDLLEYGFQYVKGGRDAMVINEGRSGSDASQWAGDVSSYLTLAKNHFTGSSVTHVLMWIGSNDAQALTPLATWKSYVKTISQSVITNGQKVIFVPFNIRLGASPPDAVLELLRQYNAEMPTIVSELNATAGTTVSYVADSNSYIWTSTHDSLLTSDHTHQQDAGAMALAMDVSRAAIKIIDNEGAAALPTITAPTLSFDGSVVTASSSTGGVTLKYTTDGSTPSSSNGSLYTGGITVTSTTTYKFIAYKSGLPGRLCHSDFDAWRRSIDGGNAGYFNNGNAACGDYYRYHCGRGRHSPVPTGLPGPSNKWRDGLYRGFYSARSVYRFADHYRPGYKRWVQQLKSRYWFGQSYDSRLTDI